MKVCRFVLKADLEAIPRVGLMSDQEIRDVTAAADELPAYRWPLPMGDQLIANLDRLRPRMEAVAAEARPIAREDVRLLAPVANPGKFICGLGNWKKHGVPLGVLGFLFKVTSASAGEGDGVQIRWTDRETKHEPELATVIGRTCTNVSEAEALNYVAGYTGGLDMTLIEKKEDYSFCKAFDTYGVLGPCIVTADEVPDPSKLGYRFWVNGELRGEQTFADLTAGPAALVAYASSVMTLYPGDVIFSGAIDIAPPVVPGDLMTLDMHGIGRMDVPVVVSPHARSA